MGDKFAHNRGAIAILQFHLWNYKLTQTFRAKIKELFLTHDVKLLLNATSILNSKITLVH